ncbi:MAG: hypothetical protein JWM89_951 [Acidimicrobiales bacterium]|nr:hypothetical protein [Acidimicrobiales bacterium]
MLSKSVRRPRMWVRPLLALTALLAASASGVLASGTAHATSIVVSRSATAAAVSNTADPGDIGWEGPSYQGSSGSPSGSKPESKLWWNDGRWWASLYDSGTDDYFVSYLDTSAETWVRTPTQLETRNNSRADALWDGTHLFVASHVFQDSTTSSSGSVSSGYPSQLRRYSYSSSSNQYTLDAGFPVQINNVRTETLVIDEDSTGRLWATWTQGKQVYFAWSTPGGTTWSTPAALPVGGTTLTADDISSVSAFHGDRIGIMWSNQVDEKMYFSQHVDGDSSTAWTPTEVAYSGTDSADDHINLKSVQDQGGRVLAAVKTSKTGSSPLVQLLDRDFSTGRWTSHVYGLGSDNHTRPIVLIDSQHQNVHMFATSGQSGGSIYEKTAPLSDIRFAAGKGTAVLTDASDPDINNATSTKQNVNGTTGLVVLATNDTTRQYWTHYDDLGGTPTEVVANAGPDHTATTNGVGTLDASASYGPSGQPLGFTWLQVDGPLVVIADPRSAKTTFRTPSDPTTLTFRVVVNDASGHVASDDVVVTVKAPK